MVEDLSKRFPLDTQMQSLWLPAIRGHSALSSKNPADALNDLQAAAPPMEWELFPLSTKSPVSIQPTFVARHTWQRGRAMLPLPSFRRFSITAASSGIAGRERWRVWELRVRTLSKRKPRKAQPPMLSASVHSPPTRTTSPSVHKPPPTSPYRGK